MEVQSLYRLIVLHEIELLFHSASFFVSKAHCLSLDTKNMSGVGLGLGPSLQEH